MKKRLSVLFIILLLLAAAIYIFIPDRIIISKVKYIKTTPPAAFRSLSDKNTWYKWWPSARLNKTSDINDTIVFSYKTIDYRVDSKMIDIIRISIKYEDFAINSFMNMISLNRDSSAIEWKSEMETGLNPLKKINTFFKAKKIRQDMSDILERLKNYLENKENIYGLSIKEEKVKDTILIATNTVSNSYPSTSEIYVIIKNLRDYILVNGAMETNYPMLNVMQDRGIYRVMVAIPVNKIIPQTNKFLFKRMVPGRILVTETKGGRYRADEAIRKLEMYMQDNYLKSPAIPFQSLVTNRSKETDSLQWVTKTYYPIY